MNFDPSRRQVIQKIALGATGSLVAPSLPASESKKAAKRLGVALVGPGNYSTRQLAPALQETELCYLAGIVTGTPEKEKIWMEKYNIMPKNVYNYQTFDKISDLLN